MSLLGQIYTPTLVRRKMKNLEFCLRISHVPVLPKHWRWRLLMKCLPLLLMTALTP